MKVVKEICPNCNKAIEYKKGELIWRYISKFFISLLVTLGIFFILYIAIVGVQKPLNDIVNAKFEYMNRATDDDVRLLSLNITKECNNANSMCYLAKLYRNVSDIRYVPSSLYDDDAMYDPLYVYENGGDCKNSANMIVAMMKSLGFEAEVSCKTSENHCISKIPYTINDKSTGYFFVVDLTIPKILWMNDGEDEWNYMNYINNVTRLSHPDLYHFDS